MTDQLPDASTKRPLIIERPDLQTLSQRWGYRSVTLFCWLLWLYLFVPLLNFVAWLAGLTFTYRVLLQGLNVNELWEILEFYAIGIGFLTGMYLLWAFYSFLRFRNVERRTQVDLVPTEPMAASHNLPPETLLEWRSFKRQVVDAETLVHMFHAQESSPPDVQVADQVERA